MISPAYGISIRKFRRTRNAGAWLVSSPHAVENRASPSRIPGLLEQMEDVLRKACRFEKPDSGPSLAKWGMSMKMKDNQDATGLNAEGECRCRRALGHRHEISGVRLSNGIERVYIRNEYGAGVPLI